MSPRIPVSLVFLVSDLDLGIYKYATWNSCRKFETNLVHDRSVFILFLKGIKSFNRLLLRPKVKTFRILFSLLPERFRLNYIKLIKRNLDVKKTSLTTSDIEHMVFPKFKASISYLDNLESAFSVCEKPIQWKHPYLHD